MNAELRITIGADGNINVTGPIGNKVLCYGLLDSAKDIVRTYHEKQQSAILPATPEALQLVRA